MFRHRGKNRTLVHNVKLAALLSFVAGIVNTTSLMALGRLTTNVTGHFAYISDEAVTHHGGGAWIYAAYVFSFLAGAFFSGLLIELLLRTDSKFSNALPVLVEIVLLILIATLAPGRLDLYRDIWACGLLFAMGLQNALVTRISNAVVRTTHLTGLFTDLGIELSQLFFYRRKEQQQRLSSIIVLRASIIVSFLVGGMTGGIGYLRWGTAILYLAAACLLVGMVYATLKLQVLLLRRKLRT